MANAPSKNVTVLWDSIIGASAPPKKAFVATDDPRSINMPNTYMSFREQARLPDGPTQKFRYFEKLPKKTRARIWKYAFPRFHVDIEYRLDSAPEDSIDDERMYFVANKTPKMVVGMRAMNLDTVRHYWFAISPRPLVETGAIRISIDVNQRLAIGTFPTYLEKYELLKNMLLAMNEDLLASTAGRGLRDIIDLQIFDKHWNGKPWRLYLKNDEECPWSLAALLSTPYFEGLREITFLVPNAMPCTRMYSYNRPLSKWEYPISHGWKACEKLLEKYYKQLKEEWTRAGEPGRRFPTVELLLHKNFFKAAVEEQVYCEDLNAWTVREDNEGDERGGKSEDWVEENVETDLNPYPDNLRRYLMELSRADECEELPTPSNRRATKTPLRRGATKRKFV